MSFNDDARLDAGRVRDTRGRRGGRVAVGGGGILVLLLAAVFGINPDMLNQLGLDTGMGMSQEQQDGGVAPSSECQTGADADARVDCRIIGTVLSLDDFWGPYMQQIEVSHAEPGVELFSGQVSTGCGTASSAVGPFYCPADQSAYFDTGFFETLRTQFGAGPGPLAEMYVVAHEYGHHIQQEIGTLQYSQQGGTGAGSNAVRVELQADCLAGMWAAHAATTEDANGVKLLEPFTQADLESALSAAEAVGDDRIQEKATGQVNPHQWTHGSAHQRQQWFIAGYNNGDIGACDTFTAADLDNP